jgi:uncharacterized membrane protein
MSKFMDFIYTLSSKLKSKKTLFLILIVLSIIFGTVFYYNKTDDEKKKITNIAIVTECVIPAFIISMMVVGILYSAPLPERKLEFLEEEFWSGNQPELFTSQ